MKAPRPRLSIKRKVSRRLWLTIAFATPVLASLVGCGTTTVSVAAPSGFCERTGQPPDEPFGVVQSSAWRKWLTDILGNYDCSCPGGKYYGKHDAMCEPIDPQHRT